MANLGRGGRNENRSLGRVILAYRLAVEVSCDWLSTRALLTNQRIREYLDQRHPETVTRFETIIAEARG